MPKLKPTAPAIDPIEQDFIAAIERLQKGKPNHKDLKAALAKGILKFNTSNVAKEACRSRTLIAMEKGCRYPRIREMIKLAKGGKNSDPKTYSELIQRLRADVANLMVQVKQYQAEATSHFLARTKAENDAVRARSEKSRLLKDLKNSEKIVGLSSTWMP